MIKNKKGVSQIIATLLLITLTIFLVSIVWGVVNRLVNQKLEGASACFDIEEKISINKAYTCNNLSSNETVFSISVGDLEVDSIILSFYSQGFSKTIEIEKNASEITSLKLFGGSSGVRSPKKNEGLVYLLNYTDFFDTNARPESIEIIPIINKHNCGIVDSIEELKSCELVIK